MISLTSPVNTRAHGWPAGLKLAGLCVSTTILFVLKSLAVQGGVLALVFILYALPGRVFLGAGMRRLWILWPIAAVLVVWHLIVGNTQEGAVIIMHMVNAVALANLVTMTTRLSEMIDVVRTLSAPLRRLGLNTAALEIAMALAVRFTPVLIGKGQVLSQAWRARSVRRPNWAIVLPFTILAIDDADHVADALKARGGLQRQKDN